MKVISPLISAQILLSIKRNNLNLQLLAYASQ